ncbi:MAG: nucleotide sugar dehydrogenase [Candidatus Hydrothermales bacterium]
MVEKILKKIKNKEIKIGVIGLGYVGLPLSELFLKKGFKVLGYDVSEEKIVNFQKGQFEIEDVNTVFLSEKIKSKEFIVSSKEEIINEMEAIFICVPTPVTKERVPDLSYVITAANSIKRNMKEGQIIVLKSTTFPETTEKILLPIFEDKDFKVGKNFYLGFVPERVNPGDKVFTIDKIPVVTSGVTKNCLKLINAIYNEIVPSIFPVSSPKIAEMSKIYENIFRNVNIALSNQMAVLCDRMGIDIWEVIEAAKTKPFGFMPFYPGPGVGGHCIPVDPYYLSFKAKEYDMELDFITLAAKVNDEMPYYVVERIIRILNKERILPPESKILILGVAFKKDIKDIRHSPAIKIISILVNLVKKVEYIDPHVPEIKELNKKSLKYKSDIFKLFDLVVILTDHSDFPYEEIYENSKLIFDTRGVYKVKSKKIYKLGEGKKI